MRRTTGVARFKLSKRTKTLGRYKTQPKAHAARRLASKLLSQSRRTLKVTKNNTVQIRPLVRG